MKIYRLEFLQPDGRWTGPYCAEYMTARAFDIRAKMLRHHNTSPKHIFPDAQIFAANPGKDRYVCGSASMPKLFGWFGAYLALFMKEGGHIAVYEVPQAAIASIDDYQIVYQQRRSVLLRRKSARNLKQIELVERIHPDKFKNTKK